MVVQLLNVTEVVVFAWGILQTKITKNWKRWVIAVLFFVSGEVFNCVCQNMDAGFWLGQLAGHMVVSIILFEETLGKSIADYWFGVFYMSVIYMPFQAVLYALGGSIEEPIFRYQAETISVLAILLMTVIAGQIKKRKQWVERIRLIPTSYISLGVLCGFCADGVSQMIWRMGAFLDERVRVFVGILQMVVNIFLYALGMSMGFISLGRQRYKRESELKDEYLKISKAHYEGLVNHMQEIRSVKHDIQAHMSVLERYLQDGKWEAAETYLQEMKANQNLQNKKLINVGNELVNAVLMDGMQRGKEEIEFISEGAFPAELTISDFDLCTMFSNLLSNSVEACLRLQEKEKKILLQIRRFEDNLAIVMENPVEWEVPVEKLGSFTSKSEKEKHGYGIRNIKQVVEKYEGEMEFQLKGDIFQVKILLYNAIK